MKHGTNIFAFVEVACSTGAPWIRRRPPAEAAAERAPARYRHDEQPEFRQNADMNKDNSRNNNSRNNNRDSTCNGNDDCYGDGDGDGDRDDDDDEDEDDDNDEEQEAEEEQRGGEGGG